MVRILFVCVHNSGRSQMAEAFANRLGSGVLEAKSAGTQPAERLNPVAVQAMQEIGYDMSGHYPKVLTREMGKWADKAVTMGCGVRDGGSCPVLSGQIEDWGLEDPHQQAIEKVREIRNLIEARVRRLVEESRDE